MLEVSNSRLHDFCGFTLSWAALCYMRLSDPIWSQRHFVTGKKVVTF
jgi:hypothetical protein